jgi:hypothetical protein
MASAYKAFCSAVVLSICAGLTFACGETKLPVSPTHEHPHVPLILHADTAFTPGERWALDSAGDEWTRRSHEAVVIVIEYDLDFTSINSINRLKDQNMILRLATEHTELVDRADYTAGAKVVALTDHDETDHTKPQRMFLISPRITDQYMFEQVALHEFGHMLWLRDSGDSKDVMYRKYTGTKCLDKNDMTELCAYYGCNVESTAYCD